MAWRGRSVLVLAMMLVGISQSSTAQRIKNGNINTPQARWVDSVYNSLTVEERIGQLFMVAAYSGGSKYNEAEITTLVSNGQVGGLIFMQGDPVSQASQTNKYQRLAKVPLLLAMDAEWGLGMRLTGVRDFPRQMMLGATRDSMLAYRLGAAVADQCKRIGVHINFAPVVDVNNNPNNPVINGRSFGEDKRMVARMGLAYMHGLQQNGVMASAKHFPGHGDTDVDSHKDLPVIRKSIQQLDTLEFYPFRRLINAGVQSVMVAHLEVPALESAPKVPTTLSLNTITTVLKEQMGFKGLVFTDALNMDGVAKYYKPGEVDLKAFMAGNDVLLFSQNVPVAIAKIKSAMDSGMITPQHLEQSVKKILAAKYDAGLNNFTPISTTNITADLNKYVDALREGTAVKAVTLVKDNEGLIGRMFRGDAKVGYIGVNASRSPLFDQLQAAMPNLRFNWMPKGSTAKQIATIKEGMAANDVNIVVIHNTGFYPGSKGRYGLDDMQMSFLQQMSVANNVVYVVMGNAYLMKNFCQAPAVVVAYEDDSIAEMVTARILLRQLAPQGRLPVTPCAGLPAEVTPEPAANPELVGPTRSADLKKVLFKEDAGVKDPAALDKLSRFMQKSIVDKAFPGARILAAKDGKIFYDEPFGYHDYSKSRPVDLNTLYDVASMTKVLATTITVMQLYDQKKLDLNKTLGDYLPWVKGTNKSSLKIRDLLLHQAGLKAWIPFYTETLNESKKPRGDLYSTVMQKDYTIPVARNLYLRDSYRDTIWKRILDSPLETKGRYVYSDLDFYFLAAVAEQITKKPIDDYVDETFYRPMGLKHITYNPLRKFQPSEIAPTENDIVFRQQLIHGYVHDQGAAMLGGVAGHAGLFATAQDAAAIYQMLLNGGVYNGKRFFKESTVKLFTGYQTKNSRRGLGFDKPAADTHDGGPAGNRVSGHAFGHQGFTGTAGWADPATGVVFIFLSNRVNPSADNNNINRQSIRTVAQDYIYEALGIPENRARKELHRQQTQ